MAKKENNTILDYGALVSGMKDSGPELLYFLWGEENFLLRKFVDELKQTVLKDSDESFCSFLFEGPELKIDDFESAIDTFPFMGEKSFILLKDIDYSKIKDNDQTRFLSLISNIPDYCVVCFIHQPDYKPDSRLKIIKDFRKYAKETEFTFQSEALLIKWVSKLAARSNKQISRDTAVKLIKACGGSMDRIKSETDKIISYTAGSEIRLSDVDMLTDAIDEADVFKLCEYIGRKQYDKAASSLAVLLQNPDASEIAIVAALISCYRNLGAARLVLDRKAGSSLLKDFGLFGYFASNASDTAKLFSEEQIKKSINLCLETDYQLKSSSQDGKAELFFLLTRLCNV